MLLMPKFHILYLGEHRRVKGMRNWPKMEKMGQRTKSTRLGLPHTGGPHACAYLTGLTMA
ncbi:hypothetical protein F383_34347 [Gossypium arboreum]|uniref:Uncharacterized protein n=1 Tax=Gossypium arboreum TaxID=29729 RepID=A0A0B0PS40_GOSAR|nr:hypothetical protein F383_34347 [Gossypium arboreum]